MQTMFNLLQGNNVVVWHCCPVEYYRTICIMNKWEAMETLGEHATEMTLLLRDPRKFGCKGKRRYNMKDDAHIEILRLMNEALVGTTNLRAYKCKHCKGWHLTSSSK